MAWVADQWQGLSSDGRRKDTPQQMLDQFDDRTAYKAEAATEAEEVSPELRAALVSIYEEVLWLARRPNVSASQARAWYTHIMSESVKRQLRRFTGHVSEQALAACEDLRLEHYKRIQTTLTSMVKRHRPDDYLNAEEFVSILIEYEQVHIVTRKENYDAMKAKGDYALAGINLVPWSSIQPERRAELWRTMLHGKVANAAAYAPQTVARLR